MKLRRAAARPELLQGEVMNEEQATEILRIVNSTSESFQSALTEEERSAIDARHEAEPETRYYPAADREQAMTEFTADALQTLADDIRSVIEQRMEKLHREALDVYYAAEELARDPANAHLIAHVEAMRLAHEKQYGYPPPPRPRV